MTVKNLVGQLRQSFGDPHFKEKAQRQLHKHRQGNKSFIEYFTEFRKLMLEAGGAQWSDDQGYTPLGLGSTYARRGYYARADDSRGSSGLR